MRDHPDAASINIIGRSIGDKGARRYVDFSNRENFFGLDSLDPAEREEIEELHQQYVDALAA